MGILKIKKPIASLSVDLDNEWSYLKTHGESVWQSFPSFFNIFVPRVLRFFAERGLTVTFFVVGQDAALDKNREVLEAIASAGHEIGNHSFHHESWRMLHYNEQQIEIELARAEDSIESVTGQRPIGYRGPGFVCTQAILSVLMRRGYLYDSSTLPSFFGPLSGFYYLISTRFSPEEKRQRREIFGSFRDGLRPLHPFQWRIASAWSDEHRSTQLEPGLIEIPVTTMPLFKIPIHFSYILYISTFSPMLAITYIKTALWLCRTIGIQPSLLLHPTDFLGCDDVKSLSFFPAMTLQHEKKIDILSQVIRMISSQFTLTTLAQHAKEIRQTSNLPIISPDFRPERSLQ